MNRKMTLEQFHNVWKVILDKSPGLKALGREKVAECEARYFNELAFYPEKAVRDALDHITRHNLRRGQHSVIELRLIKNVIDTLSKKETFRGFDYKKKKVDTFVRMQPPEGFWDEVRRELREAAKRKQEKDAAKRLVENTNQ